MPIARSKLDSAELIVDQRRDLAVDETSDERFDRMAFARHALELVRPPRTTVALCESAVRVCVQEGRNWGRGREERWAVLAIPPRASRRAIVLAVAELARVQRPYALDVLFS
jgi:hypothetical protein